MPAQLKSIAVLIDADNASAKNIGLILQEIAKLGHITCKKIYGDWGNARIKSWQEALLKYAIDPMQQFAYVKGKNATDIGLVIEAMDLLYSDKYDCFCLISSDSDFTSLAVRIRQDSVKVFGFGNRSTVDAFTKACDSFYYIEDLLPTPTITKTQDISNKTNAPNEKTIQNGMNGISVKEWDASRLKCDTKLLNSLRASIINHPKTKDERWLNFGLVSHGMKKHYPDFNPQNYGYTKLAEVVKNIDLFEMKVEKTTLYVRETKSSTVPLVAKIITKPNTSNTATQWTTKKLQAQTQLITVLDKLIKEDPKSDKGWSNISYLASQIKQHHIDIKLDKYGYKKFSDLIDALELYKTRRANKVISIKLKPQKQVLEVVKEHKTLQIKPKLNSSESVSKTKIANINFSKLVPNEHTSVTIYSSSQTDIKLFCMNTKQKNDAAKDIIHASQRHSKDSSILLTRKEANGIAKSNFMCGFEKQDKDIDQLVFLVVSKNNSTFSKDCPIIEVNINNRHKGMLFSEEFNVQNKTGKNLLLFNLNRVGSEWQFLPQNTIISGDLRELCNISDTLKS
tara:strand:- start:13270 stop:14967 length:1698 start_codon:yes stop_codon:yes gene_type:complete